MSCERYSPVRRGSDGTCPPSPRLAKSTHVSFNQAYIARIQLQ